MDMPQRRISDPGVEGIRGYGLQTSHDGALAPVVVRQLGSGSVEVSQGYDRLAGIPLGIGIGRYIRPMPATYESSSPSGAAG